MHDKLYVTEMHRLAFGTDSIKNFQTDSIFHIECRTHLWFDHDRNLQKNPFNEAI